MAAFLFTSNRFSFYCFSLSVCIKFLTNFVKKMESEKLSTVDEIEEKFRAVCAKAKNKENRFVSMKVMIDGDHNMEGLCRLKCRLIFVSKSIT